MKYIILLLVPQLLCFFAGAQESAYSVNWTAQQVDSVKKQFNSSANDTLKMKMARSIGLYHQEINRDTAFYYALRQLELAKKTGQRFWEADAYEAGGWLLSQLKNYPLSLEYLLQGQQLAENENIEENIWQLSFFSPAKDAKYTRLTTLGFIHNNLSQLYNQTGDTVNEKKEIYLGIGIAEKIGNDILMGLLKSNLSQFYVRLKAYDLVILNGIQSLYHMRKAGYLTYEGYQLSLIGNAYVHSGDLTMAKIYLDSSVIANERNGSIVKLPDAYFSYAHIFEIEQKPDSAILYYKKAASAFLYFNQPAKVATAYLSLFQLYKKNQQNDSAWHYLELYQPLNDRLNKIEQEQVQASQNFALNKQVEYQQNESTQTAKANANRTYALLAGITVLLLVAFLLFRNNRVRSKANSLLQKQKGEIEKQKATLENTLTELRSAQAQLIQSEKMASLGELTAGIAHEIQNPLNFVNNFSDVSNELVDEMNAEIDKGDMAEAKAIAADIKSNLEKINHHGKRADAIVKGMLQHSRKSEGQKEPTDINALCDEYLRLSYHGLRAKDKSFNAAIQTDFDEGIGKINIVPQDMGRVIMNLLTNAFYAVNERKKQSDKNYEPTISVSTSQTPPSGGRGVRVTVSDNGNGIPPHIVDKIFQPFFTTKPTGQGTGLGLSLAYDIVKAHGGELKVNTTEREGTEFLIHLPI